MLMIVNNLVGGKKNTTPLKNDGVQVNWDDENSQYDGKNKIDVPNHQPVDIIVETAKDENPSFVLFWNCQFLYPFSSCRLRITVMR